MHDLVAGEKISEAVQSLGDEILEA